MKFANTAYGRFEMNLVGKIRYQAKDKWFVTADYALGLGSIVNDDLSPKIGPRHGVLPLTMRYHFLESIA